MPGLDMLRGIAAVFVMLHHAEFFYGIAGLWSKSYLAVDFFFLLSGFIMVIRYETAMDEGLVARAFMVLRIRRLWPAMAVGIILGAVVSGWDGVPMAPLVIQALIQACFIPVIAGRFPMFPLNGVQWSLLIEVVANAVHALVLRRLSTRICAALLVPAGAGLFLLNHRLNGLGFGDLGANWYAGLVRAGFSYVGGILLGRLWKIRPPVGPRTAALANVSLVGLPLVLCLGSSAIGGLRYFDSVVVTLVFPPLVWLAAVAVPSCRIARVGTLLGLISYPLYAFHLPMIRAGEIIGEGTPQTILISLRIAMLVLALGLAWGWAIVTTRRAPSKASALYPAGTLQAA